MPANLNNLEAVAGMLEQSMLDADREGKPFEWNPAATVRNAAEEISDLRDKLSLLRRYCRVVYYPPGIPQPYPIEHAPEAGKDQFDLIISKAANH
jgi:hypothetical protein